MTIIELDVKSIKNCKKYFPKNEIVDIVHAATCLQENSILITNILIYVHHEGNNTRALKIEGSGLLCAHPWSWCNA